MIFFKSKVYHPLIDFETGELDLNVFKFIIFKHN